MWHLYTELNKEKEKAMNQEKIIEQNKLIQEQISYKY